MMSPIHESDLHAYADGKLPANRRAEVEAYLAVHPDDAKRVDAWRSQSRGLHAALDGVLNEAVPAAVLPPALRGGAGRPSARVARWGLALTASFASLALGGVLGWYGHAQIATLAGSPVP